MPVADANIGDRKYPDPLPYPQFNLLVGDHLYTVEDLVQMADGLGTACVSSVGIHVPDGPLTVAALLWVQHAAVDAVFLHAEIPASRAAILAQLYKCSHLVTGSSEGDCPTLRIQACAPIVSESDAGPFKIGLLTSGTTGEPKRINHTWDTLRSSVVIRPKLQGARWLGLYPLTRFAGFNTLLHALFNNATLIIPRAYQPIVIVDEIRRTRPTHVTGTPTLWRNLLMADSSKDIWTSLRQITLGGEVVDQQILSALKSAAPHVRLTHIYASTELGVCLAVSDGLAGFPAEWLDDENRDTQLRIRDNELWINRSYVPSTAGASPEGWAATGDLVEVKEGRVYIKGRRTDVLNIGGAKVLPSDVEERLLEVRGVLGACVYGRPSSISGTVLTADVLTGPSIDKTALRTLLIGHCRACLPAPAVPRIITFVESLPLSASGKTLRGR
jgi:acyl-coenzyme A synthetase/AMP-(fatty) acid ligase